VADISSLRPDSRNANKGTLRGRALLEDSLRRYGAGRSILADKHGSVIAGNKTLEAAADIGLPVRFVQTDGTELVVVQRTDLDLDSDSGRSLAYLDNRVAELDLSWDVAELLADRDAGLDLAAVGFDADELAELLGEVSDFDPLAEWQGMPAFEHEDQSSQAAFTISVFLKDSDDLAAFSQLLGKDLTGRKFVWFSKQPHGDLHEVYDEMPT
jgi:hypothetical protein